MFYDVLMKLAHQATQMHHMKDHFKRVRLQLKMLKNLGIQDGPAFDDTLEAITNKNVKHQPHEVDLNKLLGMLNDRTSKIELVLEIAEKNKKLNAQYNHLVDTNVDLVGKKRARELIDQGQCPIELYTTAHYISSKIILDFLSEHLHDLNNVNISHGNNEAVFSRSNSGREN